MHTPWLSLFFWATCVVGFYPIPNARGGDTTGTGHDRKRFIPLPPQQSSPPSLTMDVKRLPIKRNNNYPVVLSNSPSDPNAVAINEDGADYSYFCTMMFGSKQTKMYMLIDTGSANTWVMATDCNSTPCKEHNLFGDSSSLNRTTTPWSITYGTGTVSGVVASDTVAFASYKIPLSFGMANNASDDFENYPMDGILGMGRAGSNDLNTPTLMETLKSQGLITQKVIGVRLQRNSDNLKDGKLTFGAISPNSFSGTMNFIPTTNADGWEVAAGDAGVDGKACNFKGKSAIIDTGTSYILMPKSDAATLHALIPGSSQNNEQFSVPCNAKSLVQFTLGGVTYNVSPKDYVGRTSTGGLCFSNIIGHQAFGENQWILGDVFLKNVYAVFDYDQGRVGFALPASSSSSSSSSSPSSSPSPPSSTSASVSGQTSSPSPIGSSSDSSSPSYVSSSSSSATTTTDSSPFGSSRTSNSASSVGLTLLSTWLTGWLFVSLCT